MRVGLVCPYDLGVPGGVQAQVLGLADALRALDHDAHVLTAGVDGPAGVEPMGRTIKVPVNGSIAPMSFHPAAAWRAVRAARSGDFDVLHLHEPLAPSITIPVLISHPVPIVGTFHAAGDRTPYRRVAPLLRRLARRIDRRVTVSEPAAQLARHHLGGSYEILFNGVDVHGYPESPSASSRPPTILFLGRHEQRKGLEVLIDALTLLPDEVTIWIAGHGPESRRLQARSSGDHRVQWLGRLTEQEKKHRLAEASILCAPSLDAESFGVVLGEAMAAGTPIVASDLPGYRAAVGGPNVARFVTPGDAQALADGILEVLHHPHRADDLAAADIALAHTLTFETLARRYVEIYQEVV